MFIHSLIRIFVIKYIKIHDLRFFHVIQTKHIPIYNISMSEHDNLPRGCRIIDFPEFMDARGGLSFAESEGHIPFAVERVFWLYNLSGCHSRGGHSHGHCAQVVVAVHGAFDLLLDDGTTTATIHLDSPHRGVLIAPTVWDELKNFAEGTVVMVMASHHFDAEDYISDYEEYRNELVELRTYSPSLAAEWDAFVDKAKNSTFLHKRSYMDYHADRFTDCSLMFYKRDELIALLPANHVKERQAVYSHGGLTYGGLLLSENITAIEAMQAMACAKEWMSKALNAQYWYYKPTPHIYHRMPAEEDLYALFRHDATIVTRAVSSVIENANRLPLHKSRRHGANKARNNHVTYHESNNLHAFWKILDERLRTRHNNKPVHTVDEMIRLQDSFPEQIRLFVATIDDEVVAGTLIYETEQTAHTQYIASTEQGRSVRALDGLLKYLIEEVFAHKRYFDFGTSMEPGSDHISEGLFMQKGEFGARTIVYDTYLIQLTTDN